MKKRIMSLLLTFCMVVSLLQTTVFAEDDEADLLESNDSTESEEITAPKSGYCGGDTTAEPYDYLWQGVEADHATQTVYKNIAWALVENGANDTGTTYKLVLTGEGPMFDFTQKWHTGVGAETDEPWWDWHLQITEVDIAEGITTIGNLAFYSLALESLVIPDSVTSIGQSAVADNKHLASVVIGAGVETITQLAFNRDDSLKTLTFKDGADVDIGMNAFYDSAIEHLTIPSRVKSIGYAAFGENSGKNNENPTYLKSVTFEENTSLKLASTIFFDCTSLTDVDMSALDCDSSTFGAVFNGCTALENVKLPTSSHFTKLPAQMFWKCTALKSIVIPANITSWGYQSLDSSGVHTVVFEAPSLADKSELGVNLLMNATPKIVIVYTQTSEDAGYYKAGVGPYTGNKNMANAVTNGGTFKDGTVFAEGKLATPVKNGEAFKGWYTKDGTEDGDWGNQVSTVKAGETYYAQWGDAKISGFCGATGHEKDVQWTLTPNADGYTLAIFGKGAMADYTCNITRNDAKQPWRESETGVAPTDISKVEVGSGVTNIGNFACDGLSQVKKYDIAKTVETIGAWGICGQNAETYELNGNANYKVDADGVLMSADGKTMVSYPGGKAQIAEYEVPASVETLASGVFVGSHIGKITIPNTVKTVPAWSFSASTASEVVFDADVKTLPQGIFSGMSNLTQITFGEHAAITTIVGGALSNLSSIQKIDLPASVIKIGEMGIGQNTSMTELTLPDGLQEIGPQAFKAVYEVVGNLSKLTFGKKMPKMTTDSNGFSYCQILLGQDKLDAVDMTRCTNEVDKLDRFNKEYKGIPVVYTANESVAEKAKTANEDLMAYAVANGGTFADDTKFTAGQLATPTKDGYVFQGWYTKDGTKVETVEAGETYYAKWRNPATLTTNIGEQKFVVGTSTEFTFTTKANGDKETMVVGTSDFSDASAIEKLEYYEVKDGNWYELKGDFGPASGFPMADATSTFRVTFKKGGNYTFTASMKKAGTDEVVCSTKVNFSVAKATQAAPAAPTLKTSDYTSITLNAVAANANGAAAQYSKDGGKTWQDSPEFTGLIAGTAYTFAVRYAETDAYAASDASTVAEFSTLRRSSGGSSSSSSSSNSVTVSSTKNGDVTVSLKTASKGTTVTVTVKPDSGYELDTITVKDANGKTVKLTDKGNGKYTFTMPASKVTVSAEFAKIQTASTFADVPADAYYAKAVEWAVQNGITNGKGNGLFGSNDPCTRGQIVTFLWRAAGSPAPKGTAAVPADVVPGSYCYDAVAWALENGITNGLADGTFGVNNTCTRGQSVTFLYRAVGKAPSTISGFTDVAADSFCADAVAWAVENGVTNGTSATTFSPNNGCTRAQIVTFLYRAYQSK